MTMMVLLQKLSFISTDVRPPEDIADRLAPWNIYDHPIKVELLDMMVEIDPDVEVQKDWAEKLDRLHKPAKLSRKLKRLIEKLRAI